MLPARARRASPGQCTTEAILRRVRARGTIAGRCARMTADPNSLAAPRAHWLNARRLRLYPRAIFAAIAVGFAIAVAFGSGTRTLTGRLGGDFPAFYGAGRILAR